MFRNFFAPQAPSQSGYSKSRSHSYSSEHRSNSSPQDLSYIYAPAGSTTSSHSYHKRSNSYAASQPATLSSVRYATPQTQSERPPILRSASYKSAGSGPGSFPTYAPSASYSSSSRSNSSSSLNPSIPPMARSTASTRSHGSGHVRFAQHRPPLSQNHSWHSQDYSPYVPITNRSRTSGDSVSLHPLIAHSLIHHASISYDVTFAPSARTVLDRTTHTAVLSHMLSQPATNPHISTQFILKSDKLPWTITVGTSKSSSSRSGSGFYISPTKSRSKAGRSGSITNQDILVALHISLHSPITPHEWASLGHGSRKQKKVTRAYEERCVKMGGGWDGGVRRIDWLGGKTRFVGVEVDRIGEGGDVIGRVIFGKA